MSDKGYDAYAHERGMSYHSRSNQRDRDSDSASLTDSDSDLEAGRSRRPRRARGNSRAIVKREPYHVVAAPPRAYHPADSDESIEQVYGDRERRRLPEQERSGRRDAGLLVAVAMTAAAFVLCLTECCD